tara:strand:- start:2569 stop:2826 length:258 start_codon:yes stop_codon:yes gene_type:complete
MELAIIAVVMGVLVVLGAFFHFTKPNEDVVEKAFDPKVLPPKEVILGMNKLEIEALGQKYGIDLDRRKSTKNLYNDLLEHYKKQD